MFQSQIRAQIFLKISAVVLLSFLSAGCGDSTINVGMQIDYSAIQTEINQCKSGAQRCSLRVLYTYTGFNDPASGKQVTIPEPTSAFPVNVGTAQAPNYEWGRAVDAGYPINTSLVNMQVPLGKVGTEIMIEVLRLEVSGGVSRWRPFAAACYRDNTNTPLSSAALKSDLSTSTYPMQLGRTCGICSTSNKYPSASTGDCLSSRIAAAENDATSDFKVLPVK